LPVISEQIYKLPALIPAEIPNLSQKYIGFKSLIIDLDETLVSSSIKAFPNPDLVFTVSFAILSAKQKIQFEGKPLLFYVKERPGAREFLELMSQHYELIVFTASVKEVLFRIDT